MEFPSGSPSHNLHSWGYGREINYSVRPAGRNVPKECVWDPKQLVTFFRYHIHFPTVVGKLLLDETRWAVWVVPPDLRSILSDDASLRLSTEDPTIRIESKSLCEDNTDLEEVLANSAAHKRQAPSSSSSHPQVPAQKKSNLKN